MDWEHDDDLRSATTGLRNQLEYVMNAYEEQRTQLADVQQKMAAVRAQARSADGLVEVTVDSTGTVVEVELHQAALRTTPERLGQAITETAQAAAHAAKEQANELIAPIADLVPDLPDLIPGAPSLREPLPTDEGDSV